MVGLLTREIEMTYDSITPLNNQWVNKTVSEGTLRTQDLISSMLGVLEHTRHQMYNRVVIEWVDVLNSMFEDNGQRDSEQETLLHDHLFELLNSLAPTDCVFGASEGDGACFGFWEVAKSL